MSCKINQCSVLLSMAKYSCPKGTSFLPLNSIIALFFFQNALNILAPKYQGFCLK